MRLHEHTYWHQRNTAMTEIEPTNSTTEAATENVWSDDPARIIGFLAGLTLASVSLSSGFIWVCGQSCVQDGIIWTSERRVPLAFLAAWSFWWGYLIAHRSVTGRFIDPGSSEQAGSPEPSDQDDNDRAATLSHVISAKLPSGKVRIAGFLIGISMLVSGIAVGFIYIRQGNHLLTNIGGFLFFSGYVIAHYTDTGVPL